MKILLLEDEPTLRELIKEQLELKGHIVSAFDNGNEAMNGLFGVSFDIMLVDINVPGMNGYDFIKALKDMGDQTPVIIISSHTDIDHLAKGYDIGCDDYLKKPFDFKELDLRMTTILKKNAQLLSTHVQLIGNYSVALINGELYKHGELVVTHANEKKLLTILAKNYNSTVSTIEIIDYIWERETSEGTLRALVHKLRKRLDQDIIINEKGSGYCFALAT